MTLPLSKLLNTDIYQPGLWILPEHPQARDYWKKIFFSNLHNIANLIDEPDARECFINQMTETIEEISKNRYTTVHEVTVKREQLLNQIGVPDPYENVKKQENEKALVYLKPMLNYLNDLDDPSEAFSICLSAILTGNQFDLGSKITADLWHKNQLDFKVDFKINPGYKKFFNYFHRLQGTHITILVDNAGFDYLVGSVSLIRFLINSGFSVTVGANSSPALNDVTYQEVIAMNKKLNKLDSGWVKAQQQKKLSFIDSGCLTPGINLKKISRQLDHAVNESDLLILVGQGRAIETTLNAKLDINVFRIAKVKDSMVASYIDQPPLSDFIYWSEPGEQFNA